ncbi:sulfite exporter TauE/SafE family protein [Ectothiorhodospiraceae bacterium WFHF3C12]|nr:sulfite exporter TauE/SafE family protein [Ectothiorhodospiraceae bacterium WFHF3C12]
MDLSTSALGAAALMVFLGALVQTSVGFGMAVVAAPILYLIEPRMVPVPLLVMITAISAYSLWRTYSHLHLAELSSAFVGRIPGIALAMVLLSYSSGGVLPLLIGLSVLSMVAASLTSIHFTPTRNRLFVAGLASGFMGTATAIGGPAMALVYQHADGERIRANLSAYFLLGALMSLCGLALIGRIGEAELLLSAGMLPPTVAGMLAGRFAVRFLGPAVVRPAILGLSSIAGCAVVLEWLLGRQ